MPVRINWLARANHGLPPAVGRVGFAFGRVRVGRQPGQDKDGIGALRVKLTPGFVGHVDARNAATAGETKWPVMAQVLGRTLILYPVLKFSFHRVCYENYPWANDTVMLAAPPQNVTNYFFNAYKPLE